MDLFDKAENAEEHTFVLLHLNARLQPVHRGEWFEDLFDEVLKKHELGEVTGGGTLQKSTGEIDSCDIEMNVKQKGLEKFISFIKKIDIIPKGSQLEIGENKIDIGTAEGLAIYLNGTDLPIEVYRSCDINYLIGNLDRLLDEVGTRLSHWEGSTETALYFYGRSYEEMKEKISDFLQSYPLCEKCRVVKIV